MLASTITAVAAVVGATVSATGAAGQARAQRAASAASRRAEAARLRQMNLETQRKQRSIYREQMRARSVALANTTNQGASAEGSSALPGGIGQISGEAGRQSLALAENQAIGSEIFSANAAMASAQGDAATWQGVGSIGQNIFANAERIGRIGNTMMTGDGSPSRGWQTFRRDGSGYII